MYSIDITSIHARAVELRELIRGLALMADDDRFRRPRVALTHTVDELADQLAEEIDKLDEALTGLPDKMSTDIMSIKM